MGKKSNVMKILFVIDTYKSNNNGTSVSARRFADELRRRWHKVKVLCVGESGDEVYGVSELRIPVFDGLIKKHDFTFGRNDQKTIRRAVEWADVVHCYMPFALEYHARTMSEKLHKPCTAAFHIQPQNLTSSVNMGKIDWVNDIFYDSFRLFIYRHHTHIHVPSKFMADEIEKRGYNANIHVISNGIDSDFVYTKRPKAPEYCGKTLVMMIGRLAGEKRQDVLINAVKYSKHADDIQLVFAGHGPKQKEYEQLGRQLKNPPEFGYFTKHELIELLSQCDLYAHASDMESEAIACLEAMSTGLVPVIANSEMSATPQFALDGRSLFKPGSPKDLARAMDYWLDNPNEREQMEQRYAAFAKGFSLEESVSKFEEMLNEAVCEMA